MIARVKATGEIVEINETHTEIFTDVHDNAFSIDEIDFNVVERKDPDYWTRLEHQAAIAAMGGICGNTNYDETTWSDMAEDAIRAAHALVEKLKELEERK